MPHKRADRRPSRHQMLEDDAMRDSVRSYLPSGSRPPRKAHSQDRRARSAHQSRDRRGERSRSRDRRERTRSRSRDRRERRPRSRERKRRSRSPAPAGLKHERRPRSPAHRPRSRATADRARSRRPSPPPAGGDEMYDEALSLAGPTPEEYLQYQMVEANLDLEDGEIGSDVHLSPQGGPPALSPQVTVEDPPPAEDVPSQVPCPFCNEGPEKWDNPLA